MSDAPAASPAKPLPVGKILGMAFAAINLAVVGGGLFFIFTMTVGYEPPNLSEEQALRQLAEFHSKLEDRPAIYTMEPLNTNLDGVPRRLVRVQISLEMLDEEGFEEVMNLGAGARDSLMRLLNGKTFEELASVQGKLQLKNQIIAQMNSYMKRGVVKQVYFSDFVVQ